MYLGQAKMDLPEKVPLKDDFSGKWPGSSYELAEGLGGLGPL